MFIDNLISMRIMYSAEREGIHDMPSNKSIAMVMEM